MSALTPLLETAKEILSESKSKEMHVNDIAKEAVLKNKNMGMTEEIFAKKLSAALAANLKTQKPVFAKPLNKQGGARRGVYRLKKNAITSSQIPVVKPPTVSTLYLGKGGEYAVASELLFFGFNISIMAVDEGIDILAEKGGKFHHIQVKTSTSDTGDNFSFRVLQKSFDACQHLSPWYIFVMRKSARTDYAIIPSSLLLHMRSANVISGKDISVQIMKDSNGKQYKLNGAQDINMYINNFGLIR